MCALSAAGAVVAFALCSLTGTTGAEIAAHLEDDLAVLQIGSVTALLAAAGLMLAGGRLALHVSARPGRSLPVALVPVAAGAVAVLFAAYYAVFGAGSLIASEITGEPGAGVGESAWILLNLVEMVRYVPGLVLVAAAVALRDRLPRGVWVAAGVLVVMTLVPLTSWVAALLIPLWLAVTGAVLPGRSD